MHANRGRCRVQQLHTRRYLHVLGKLVTKRQAPAADTCFPCDQHGLEAFCGFKDKAWKAVKRKITLLVGYLWDSYSGERPYRNTGWSDYAKAVFSSTDAQFLSLWPTKSPGTPAPLKVQCLRCGTGSMRCVCVCMSVWMCHSNLSKTFSLHLLCLCVASPASHAAAAPAPLAHLTVLAPGSWFWWPALKHAHLGDKPLAQGFPPTSSWQQWQDLWETLPPTCMPRCLTL